MTGSVIEARRGSPLRGWIEPPAAPRRAMVVSAVSLAAWVATWAAGDRTAESAVLLALAIGGAGATAYLVPLRPAMAFGILFLLATASRITIELPFGTMRMEHPAIAFAALAMLFDRRRAVSRALRPRRLEVAILGLIGGYVVALAASSALAAPQPAASLRMVAWTAISVAGGVIAFLLLRAEPLRALAWYRTSAIMLAGAGLAVGAWYAVQGPSEIPGMSAGSLPWRKVYAFAWEPNLFASFLAAMAPFAVDRFRQHQTVRNGVVAGIILAAIGLGVTRGAYLGLVAGFAAYIVLLLWRRGIGSWQRPFAAAGLATVAGVFAASIVLSTPLSHLPAPGDPGSSAGPGASGSVSSPGPGASGPVSSPGAGATARPTPLPETPDTLAHRLERVGPALRDLATSPWIGLGAASFGQRHADSSQGGAPDHIAILAVALVYEAGVIGALCFTIAVGLLLLALTRASRSRWAMGPAAAYVAAIVALLVAYQATNALVFGLNWLLGGAALALAVRARDSGSPGIAETGHTT